MIQKLKDLIRCYDGCCEEYYDGGGYPSVGESRYMDDLRYEIVGAAEKAMNEFDNIIELMNKKRFDVKRFKWAFPSREAYNVSIKERDQSWGDTNNSHWDSTLDEEQWNLLSKYFGGQDHE